MMSSVPTINLNDSDVWVSSKAFLTVWDTLHPWFEGKGYLLYPRNPDHPDRADPGTGDEYKISQEPPKYPFAQTLRDDEYQRSFFPLIGLWAAVDTQHRDVVIKLAPNDENDLRVARMLSTESVKSDPNNLVIPILDVLEYDKEFSFIVMPRWSDLYNIKSGGFDTLDTSLIFAKNMLQALTFLHKNGIAHCDISLPNILVNFCGNAKELPPTSLTPRENWKPCFVLCDFNISIVFSPDTPHSKRVVAVDRTSWGTHKYHPPDGQNGDTTYDPFAFDVACMGGLLCEVLTTTSHKVPLLAPLLDRMITPDITQRFTAPQALSVLTEIASMLDQDLRLTKPPRFIIAMNVWQRIDRWYGLPEDFVKKHAGAHGPVRPRIKTVSYDSDGHPVTLWKD